MAQRTKLTKEQHREATAYHEAGHAVVAYYFGAWLHEEGVEIDARQYTGLRFRVWDYTTEARVIVSMAGALAEHKHHRRGRRSFVNESTAECLEMARRGEDEGDTGDGFDIAVAVLAERPAITDAEYAKALRRYRRQAWAILNEPDVWRAIENLATALMKAGRLTNDEAQAAIGWPLMGRIISARHFLSRGQFWAWANRSAPEPKSTQSARRRRS